MTKEKFEKGYAERSGVTVEWLHSKGLVTVPCNCDYEKCEGWQMVDLQNFAQQPLSGSGETPSPKSAEPTSDNGERWQK